MLKHSRHLETRSHKAAETSQKLKNQYRTFHSVKNFSFPESWPTHEQWKLSRKIQWQMARELFFVNLFLRATGFVFMFLLHTQYRFDAVSLLRCACTEMYRWGFHYVANTNTKPHPLAIALVRNVIGWGPNQLQEMKRREFEVNSEIKGNVW